MLWHIIRLLINNRHVIINRHSVDYLKNVVNTTFCSNMQVLTCITNIVEYYLLCCKYNALLIVFNTTSRSQYINKKRTYNKSTLF